MKRLGLLFVSTAIFGVLASVLPARIYTNLHPEQLHGNLPSIEFEKEYVDQFSDRIKWLETIAYAVLCGIVGLRWSQEKLATHSSIAISAGCLVVSLFNGYSAHDQVLQALRLGTPMLLWGRVSRVTIICQFWFLAIAVALVAIRLLSVPRMAHRKVLYVLAVFAASAAAHAQAGTAISPTDSKVRACVTDWVKTRFAQTASPADLTLLGRTVAGTANAKTISLNANNTCAFSASILDYVLSGSYAINGDRDYDDFLQEAQSVDRGVNHPGAGQSAIVKTLLSVAEIWHNALGVVNVNSAQAGDEVFVDDYKVGLTPFTCAVAPGTHDLKVKRNGNLIDSEKIEVSDGDKLQLKIN